MLKYVDEGHFITIKAEESFPWWRIILYIEARGTHDGDFYIYLRLSMLIWSYKSLYKGES
jgi:hypothetical protein